MIWVNSDGVEGDWTLFARLAIHEQDCQPRYLYSSCIHHQGSHFYSHRWESRSYLHQAFLRRAYPHQAFPHQPSQGNFGDYRFPERGAGGVR